MANHDTQAPGHAHGPAGESGLIPCTIKLLPPEERIAAAATAVRINPANNVDASHFTLATGQIMPPEHLAVLVGKRWPSSGVHLTVGFLGSVDPALRARILSHMNSWSAYCNVGFSETTVNPQVRISLTGSGYWSYLGTDVLHIPAGQPTMNLQNFSMSTPESEYRRVVRHETGHTLGFPHEHLRGEIVNQIDPAKAKAFFLANDGWDAATTTAQVLTPIPESALLATAHADPTSIMCYWLPAQIMKNNVAVAGGTDIDAQDQAFAAVVYPKPKSVFKDTKDHKSEKFEKIEHKEKAEKIELKEKVEKLEHKEKIEKLEHKEKNELIEHKFDKHLEGPVGPGPVMPGGGAMAAGMGGGMTMNPMAGSLALRVQQLEATVATLTSFIDASLRPDLGGGALRHE